MNPQLESVCPCFAQLALRDKHQQTNFPAVTKDSRLPPIHSVIQISVTTGIITKASAISVQSCHSCDLELLQHQLQELKLCKGYSSEN